MEKSQNKLTERIKNKLNERFKQKLDDSFKNDEKEEVTEVADEIVNKEVSEKVEEEINPSVKVEVVSEKEEQNKNIEEKAIEEVKPIDKKVKRLRNSVIACYYIACTLFFGVMFYFSLSLILSLFVPEASVMFGEQANNFTLGLASVFGAFIYAFMFGIALLPIGIAFLFRNGKARYVSILKGANKENMEIVFARLEFTAMLIYEVILNIIIFFAIFVCFTNALTIIGILLSVTFVVSIVFMSLVITDLVRNRVAYNKLTEEEKEEIKAKIKSFKKEKVKKERRKNAGKLY